MLQKIKNWFSKDEKELDIQIQIPEGEIVTFILKVDDIQIGKLFCDKGKWYFKYADDFKNHNEEYNRIVGFSDLNKTYESETLWPFFQIRIPGLKQPAIQEILEKEKIDKTNEVALLKRFGQRTISNSYELVMG